MTLEEKELLLQEEDEEETGSFNFMEIVYQLRSKLAWILAAALLGTLLAYSYSCFFIKPQYTAKVIMYVSNKKSTDYMSSISQTELRASEGLVPNYIEIIGSKAAMQRALEQPELEGYSLEQLQSMVSMQLIEGMGIFSINVTGEEQYKVADIANVVAESGLLEIPKYIEGTTATIIDYAVTPMNKSYPSNKRNGLMGFVAGAVICMGVVVLMYFCDSRIKKSDDFAERMGAPVLGVIPDMNTTTSGNSYGGDYYKSENTGGKH